MGTSLCVFIIREYGKLQYLLCRGQWCWTLLEFGQRHISLSDCCLFFFAIFYFFIFLLTTWAHVNTSFRIAFSEFLFCDWKLKSSYIPIQLPTSRLTHCSPGVKTTVHCWWSVKFAPDGVHRPAVTDMLRPPDGVQLRGELQIEANYILSTAKWFAVVCP